MVIKATPVASHSVPIWIPSRNLSVFISFLMVFPVVYTNILEGISRRTNSFWRWQIPLEREWEKKLQFIYLSQVMPYAVTACKTGTWSLLESGNCG